MKKLLSIILLLAITLLTSSCAGGNIDERGTASVIIRSMARGEANDARYDISLEELADKEEGVMSLLRHLKDEGVLNYSVTEGPYGAYIDSIANLVPDVASGEYIAVYTSEESEFSTVFLTELDYDGTKLMAAGVGISQMSVKDGTVILFMIESY